VTIGQADSLIGRLIDGRYQVRSRIARGGMATVYLATDLRLERKVAIKVMHGHLSDDAKFRERFIQEARSAARLAHPNVVNVFDQGQDSDMAYLVMEYLPGITLRDLLQEHGLLTTDQTLDILEAVLAGLSAAHKAGIVHRDLKPENVLLADDGRIKIGDFGLARAASANTATGAALLGTIAYLSPELVTRGIADTRSDIYAVGIMTYEMVTGVQPFTGEQPMQIAYQHANDTVPAPSEQNPQVPAEIDELVVWATSRDPDDRPRDAKTLLSEVLAVRSALDDAGPLAATSSQRTVVFPEAVAPPAPPRRDTSETTVISPVRRRPVAQSNTVEQLAENSTRRRRRGRWIIPLVLLIALLAGGTGWYFGLGPGAHATVPSLAGDSVHDAQLALTAAGLQPTATTTTLPDPDVERGRVSGTQPAVGSSLVKGARVTIIVSSGPALIKIPPLTGLTEAEAKDAIRNAHFLVGKTVIHQFDAKIDQGTVVDYLGADGKSLLTASTYSEKRAITLVVSAGPLPNVTGMTVPAAQAALSAAGLKNSAIGSQAYSTTVKTGDVIGIEPQKNAAGVGRVFRVGDTSTVLLITSKGPPMVTVPNVIGMTWAKAKAILGTQDGFTLVYDHNADALGGNIATVTQVSPGAGASLIKGSKLTITFNFQ
jgi:serine/threonine protein kinase/beta-lactam-binding protein with PASTA domain